MMVIADQTNHVFQDQLLGTLLTARRVFHPSSVPMIQL